MPVAATPSITTLFAPVKLLPKMETDVPPSVLPELGDIEPTTGVGGAAKAAPAKNTATKAANVGAKLNRRPR